MYRLLYKILFFCHRLVKGVANRVLDKKIIRPRNFSNAILKRYASQFSGEVINVSGWKDEDGEGGHYRDYFTQAVSYIVSNVSGQHKGLGSIGDDYQEVQLNLTVELPVDLKGKFDVVFNHTTLEHIFPLPEAFGRLCELSRDAVIVVVPVMQQIHNASDFGDYWRPTTMAIAKMFLDNGFAPLVIKCNDQPFAPIYCFALGVRQPEKYVDKIKPELDFQMGAANYGSSLKADEILKLLQQK